MKYYKVCRVRCLDCGQTVEHVNKTKTENSDKMLYCSCGNVGLDPSASLYRVVAKPGACFEDLSEEWKE